MKGSESYQSDAPEPQSLGCCLGLVSDGLGESYRVNHRVVRAEAAPSLTALLGDRYVAGRCPEEQTVTGEVELVAVGDVVRRLRQALAEVLPSLAAVVRAAHSHRTPLGDAKLVALHRLDPGTVWILGSTATVKSKLARPSSLKTSIQVWPSSSLFHIPQ